MPPKRRSLDVPKQQNGQGRSTNPQAYRQTNRTRKRSKYISNGDIRRMARRGGIKRISQYLYPEAKDAMFQFMKGLLLDAMIYMNYAKRTTLLGNDVQTSARKWGKSLLGTF